MTSSIPEDIRKQQDKGDQLPANVVIGDLKRVVVKEGKEAEFESLFRELAAKAKAHDRGVQYYDLYKSEQPRTYLVMSQYEDKGSLQRHQRSEHGRHYFPKIRELLESIEVSYHLGVVQLRSL
ncbi:MAG TPA: antibiotic biosynthesis monooxygenase [Nitrososphaera sp.]|nr:antibiotic biosynthesis monooxygenase [Nitrososphaera sp.]